MAVWECGTCEADFRSYQELDAHQKDAHNARESPAMQFPASAKEKPLGRGNAPEAQDLRTGRKGGMGTRQKREDPHPTGFTSEGSQPRKEKPANR